jgi:hypothetical protein
VSVIIVFLFDGSYGNFGLEVVDFGVVFEGNHEIGVESPSTRATTTYSPASTTTAN